MGQHHDDSLHPREEAFTEERIPDLFVNQRKLQARLESIYKKPIQCYWRQGVWYIDNAPRPLEEVHQLRITVES